MPIPIIVAAAIAAGAAAGGGGLALGGKGAVEIKRAKARVDAAVAKYETRREATDHLTEQANQRLAGYGEQQGEAVDLVVKRMVDFMIRNEKKVKENQALLIDGLDARAERMGDVTGPGLVEGLGILSGIAGGAAAGAGAGAATGALAGLGTASTGAAISGLSGAAATNATMAWLGGGALSAGGGGMAAGAMVMNAAIAGPALLVTGFVIGKQAAKATTKACEAETAVDVAIAELDLFDENLRAVLCRCTELSGILGDLTTRGTAALDELESEPFEPALHADRFQRAFVLAKAVKDVVSTPLMDDEGTPTTESHTIVTRWKNAHEEAENG